jgi:hypothetical protein
MLNDNETFAATLLAKSLLNDLRKQVNGGD